MISATFTTLQMFSTERITAGILLVARSIPAYTLYPLHHVV